MKKLITIAVTSITCLSPILFYASASAASATLYMSPSSGNYKNGSSLSVDIYEESGAEPVNGVQANFSYPTSDLSFQGISNSGAFGIAAQSSGGGGNVTIARGAMPSVTGTQLVAIVNFTVTASSGTASLSFTGGSSVVSASSNTDIMTSDPGGSFSLAPASSGSSSGSGSSSNKSSSKPAATSSGSNNTSTSATSTKPATPAPPTISAIHVTGISMNSATINWTTSTPTTSEIDYGLNASYGLSAVDTNTAASHSMQLNSPLIIPGTIYHFKIIATDTSAQRAASSDQTFTTKGVSLVVILKDSSGKPLANVTVTYNGQSATTNSEGQATLTNLPSGKIIIAISSNGKLTDETVDISGSQKQAQTVSFKLDSNKSSYSPYAVIAVSGFILLIVGAGLWFPRLRLNKRLVSAPATPANMIKPETDNPDNNPSDHLNM